MRTRILAVFTGLAFAAAAPVLAQQQVGSFHRSFPVSGHVSLDVSGGSSLIQVTGVPGSAVVVDAVIRQGWSFWNGPDPQAVQTIENNPPVDQQGNHISLRQVPNHWASNNISISYTVTTPPDTDLHARNGSGRIEVTGVHGFADLGTGSGTIHAQDIGGDLRADTGSGTIEFSHVGGSARLSTGSGTIRGAEIGGRISASTGSGHISIREMTAGGELHTSSGGMDLENVAGDLSAHAASGSIRVLGKLDPNRHWELSAASGDIDLDLPASTAAQAHLQTASGGIHIALPTQRQSSWGRHTWEGTLGSSGESPSALLNAHTASGSITIN